MTTQHFKLENLSCPSCVMHLQGMEDQPGIAKVDANFGRQAMRVDYDETQHSPDSISALVSEMGYIAIPVQIDDNNSKGAPSWKKFFRW